MAVQTMHTSHSLALTHIHYELDLTRSFSNPGSNHKTHGTTHRHTRIDPLGGVVLHVELGSIVSNSAGLSDVFKVVMEVVFSGKHTADLINQSEKKKFKHKRPKARRLCDYTVHGFMVLLST